MAPQEEKGEENKTKSMSSIKREGRCIPNLVFQIEEYEKALITVTKICEPLATASDPRDNSEPGRVSA